MNQAKRTHRGYKVVCPLCKAPHQMRTPKNVCIGCHIDSIVPYSPQHGFKLRYAFNTGFNYDLTAQFLRQVFPTPTIGISESLKSISIKGCEQIKKELLSRPQCKDLHSPITCEQSANRRSLSIRALRMGSKAQVMHRILTEQGDVCAYCSNPYAADSFDMMRHLPFLHCGEAKAKDYVWFRELAAAAGLCRIVCPRCDKYKTAYDMRGIKRWNDLSCGTVTFEPAKGMKHPTIFTPHIPFPTQVEWCTNDAAEIWEHSVATIGHLAIRVMSRCTCQPGRFHLGFFPMTQTIVFACNACIGSATVIGTVGHDDNNQSTEPGTGLCRQGRAVRRKSRKFVDTRPPEEPTPTITPV